MDSMRYLAPKSQRCHNKLFSNIFSIEKPKIQHFFFRIYTFESCVAIMFEIRRIGIKRITANSSWSTCILKWNKFVVVKTLNRRTVTIHRTHMHMCVVDQSIDDQQLDLNKYIIYRFEWNNLTKKKVRITKTWSIRRRMIDCTLANTTWLLFFNFFSKKKLSILTENLSH